MRIVTLWLTVFAVLSGCGHSGDRRPPGVPPTPSSVSRDEPGGDAHDPHHAALDRLLTGEWGWRNDRRDVFHFPLSDWGNWRRVRFWGMPTFVAFRYGNKHRAVAALWARRLQDEDPESLELCLERMEAWATPVAELYHAEFIKRPRTKASWKTDDDVLVQPIDAIVNSLFSRSTYHAVAAATFAWPRVCVVYGYAFRSEEEEGLAAKVRDRYAREAFSRLTVNDPLRSPDGIELLPTVDLGEAERLSP